MFCNILIRARFQRVYYETEAVQAVVGTHSPLINSLYDLKSWEMNVPRSIIRELMFYEFELHQNATEATKDILLCEM